MVTHRLHLKKRFSHLSEMHFDRSASVVSPVMCLMAYVVMSGLDGI
jgi:hypothetical protein